MLQNMTIEKCKGLLFIGLVSIFFSCKSDQKMVDQKWDEVMELHDITMPMSSDINREVRRLKKIVKVSPDSLRISKAIKELQYADEQMWRWMNNIKQPTFLLDSFGQQGAIQYLNEMEVEMGSISKLMTNSLEKAKDYK